MGGGRAFRVLESFGEIGDSVSTMFDVPISRAPAPRSPLNCSPMRTDHQANLQLILTLQSPPPGVDFAVQRGRDELVRPFLATADSVSLAITLTLGPSLADGSPNFRGPFAQGTPADRFVYVNSGLSAGQTGTPWQRRAKIKLADIPIALVERAAGDPNAAIEACIEGTMKDGGPVCASVRAPQISWQVVMRSD